MFECWWAVLVVNDGLQPLVIWVENFLLHHGHRRSGRGKGGMCRHHCGEGGGSVDASCKSC